MIRSSDLVIRYLRVLFLMVRGHGTQSQNLRSVQYSPHSVRHMSVGTMQSQSVGIACLIGVCRRKAVGDVAMLEKRFMSDLMDLAMLNFSFKFHTILWAFHK